MFKIMDCTPLPLIEEPASSKVRLRSYCKAMFYEPARIRPHKLEWPGQKRPSMRPVNSSGIPIRVKFQSTFFAFLSSATIFTDFRGRRPAVLRILVPHYRCILFYLFLFFTSFVSLTRTSETRHEGTLILSLRS